MSSEQQDDGASERRRTEELGKELENEPGLKDRPRNQLPPEMEREIEERRQQNVLAATIAGLSWGKNMTPIVRRAFADYCARFDVDPITEMDNLGGTPYVNSEWYRRKLGELIILGIVKDYTIEHIHADPRLRRLMEDEKVPAQVRLDAQVEWYRLQRLRIQYNAPEQAEAIAVCRIFLPNGTVAEGCKWAGGGTSIRQPRHGGGNAPNPITEMNPALSVESSSVRRAMSKIISHVSGQRVTLLKWATPEAKAELAELQKTAATTSETKEAAPPADTPLRQLSAQSDGGYGIADTAEIERRINESRARAEGGERVKARPAPLGFDVLSAQADPYGMGEQEDDTEFQRRVRGDRPVAVVEPPVVAAPKPATSATLDAGREVTTGPGPSAPTPDLFGGTSAAEPTALDAVECESCFKMIRTGHPEDHDPKCEGYTRI
jgi:hypothetical protein